MPSAGLLALRVQHWPTVPPFSLRSQTPRNLARTLGCVLLRLASLAYAIVVVAIAWEAPNKGFLAFTDQRIVYVDTDREAYQAGLRVGDVVGGVDGRETRSTLDYVNHVLSRRPGERTMLTVERTGVRHDYRPAPLASIRRDAAALMALVLLGLGLLAIVGRPGRRRAPSGATVIYATVRSPTNLLFTPRSAPSHSSRPFSRP